MVPHLWTLPTFLLWPAGTPSHVLLGLMRRPHHGHIDPSGQATSTTSLGFRVEGAMVIAGA